MSSAQVRVCETALRDGLQSWPAVIPTDQKVRLVEAIAAAGFAEVDVTSLVPASVVPQFEDAEALLAASPASVRVRVLTVNEKGAERVVAAHTHVRHIDSCGIPFSVSEPHNVANLRRGHAEHRSQVESIVEILRAADIEPLIGLATAWGCPIRGRIDPDEVLGLVAWLFSIGVRRVMFGDTVGAADPSRTRSLFATAMQEWPDIDFVAHFHDNRGAGIANVIAAIEVGVLSVDASLGGLGGEPRSVDQGNVGDPGNVVTEDLTALLARMGIDTGLDVEAVLAAGVLLETVTGGRLHSKVLRAGPVRDQINEVHS